MLHHQAIFHPKNIDDRKTKVFRARLTMIVDGDQITRRYDPVNCKNSIRIAFQKFFKETDNGLTTIRKGRLMLDVVRVNPLLESLPNFLLLVKQFRELINNFQWRQLALTFD